MPLTLCRFLLSWIMRMVIVGLGMVFSVFAADVYPDLAIGYQGERGVEAKGLVNAGFDVDLFSFLTLDGVISFSFVQHSGFNGYGLGARFAYPPLRWLNLTIGVQHNQWNDWHAGENRQFFLIRSQPIGALGIGLGLCRRDQVFFPPEYNVVYLLSWRFFQNERLRLFAELSNYERLEIQNPQQFPFGISGVYQLSPDWQIFAVCRSAINGFSTGLVSFTEIKAELGLKYGR